MHNARIREEKQLESAICESDLGFELLDMLAQANIDFRRLPQEELRNLMASFRTGGNSSPPQRVPIDGVGRRQEFHHGATEKRQEKRGVLFLLGVNGIMVN